MEIRQITLDDIDLLLEFFENSNTSDDHRPDTFNIVPYLLRTDENYRGFANFIEGRIVSVCFMKELTEQKAQVLDFISTRTGTSIFKNRVGEVVDYAIRFGENKGIYRFYTFLTEEMLGTVDVLKKKNLVFTWRERYDTYLDETIEKDCFSKYYLHWVHIMNSTVRQHKKNVRHHHLKPEYIERLCHK